MSRKKGKEKEMDNIENIIDRIKKAVRLANKTTEAGERDVAMRLARNLADKHGIAFSEIELDAETAAPDKPQREDAEGWESYDAAVDARVCVILRKHFAVVRVLYVNKARGKVRYTYFGSRLNIDIAKYVADILRREAKKAWREVKKAEKDGVLGFALKRCDYMAGFFFRIHQKLLEHPIRNDLEAVKKESERAEEMFRQFADGEKIENKKPRTSNNMDSRAAGYERAGNISLNRPCGTGTPSSGKIEQKAVLGLR